MGMRAFVRVLLCKHLVKVVQDSRCIENIWTTRNILGSQRGMYMQETLSSILQIPEIDLREVILFFQSYLIFSWMKEENLQTTFEKASPYNTLLTETWFGITSCSVKNWFLNILTGHVGLHL